MCETSIGCYDLTQKNVRVFMQMYTLNTYSVTTKHISSCVCVVCVLFTKYKTMKTVKKNKKQKTKNKIICVSDMRMNIWEY